MARALVLVALLCGAVALASAGRPSPREWEREPFLSAVANGETAAGPEPWRNYTQVMSWFDQRLDHFNHNKPGSWKQRTWVVDDFWTPDGTGPVIHYLCGEYTCPGVNPARLFPLELAYEHRARVVVVEHRYYGESQPFAGSSAGPLSVDALKFLNSRQALADLAHFQETMQREIDAKYGHGKPLHNKWFVIGGSYPGAMSAWYRLKYPHLVSGSLASSGVVNAILAFDAFDTQVSTSAGADCSTALRATTAALEAGLPGVKAQFGTDASQLSDDDFLYFCADTMAESVQYGSRLALCSAVTSGTNYVEQFANFSAVSGASAGAAGYNAQLLADPVNGGDGRSWWWQTCAEFGWFQIAPAHNSIRSQRINLQYHLQTCQTIFGQPMTPDVNGTNAHYGGAHPKGTRVFFTNGQEDPWQWASIRSSTDPELPARVTDCTQCAHCVELYTPAPTDAATLLQTRDMSTHYVRDWLHREN